MISTSRRSIDAGVFIRPSRSVCSLYPLCPHRGFAVEPLLRYHRFLCGGETDLLHRRGDKPCSAGGDRGGSLFSIQIRNGLNFSSPRRGGGGTVGGIDHRYRKHPLQRKGRYDYRYHLGNRNGDRTAFYRPNPWVCRSNELPLREYSSGGKTGAYPDYPA